MSLDQSMNHWQLLRNYSGKYCHNCTGVFTVFHVICRGYTQFLHV